MKIVRKFFPEIIPDNEETFIKQLIGYIESIDELSYLQISRLRDSYQFRISTSLPKYTPVLLKEIIHFHNVFGIRLDISKSIKSSGTLIFKINLQ